MLTSALARADADFYYTSRMNDVTSQELETPAVVPGGRK
jgi:hypothetical protein